MVTYNYESNENTEGSSEESNEHSEEYYMDSGESDKNTDGSSEESNENTEGSSEESNETVIKYNITEGMLCAGGVRGEDSCWGDSGGPLTYKTRGQHILIGAVSWGVECGLENKYGVYSSISYYRDWIEEN